MEAWMTARVAHSEAGTLARIVRTNDRGHEVLAAEGYEVERSCGVPGGAEAWTERVLVRRSPRHAQQPAAGLETRLGHAEKNRAALTPPRGRGKRQITDETALAEAIDTVLQDHRVHGLLSVAWEKQIERKTQYVGRGRGAASRQQRVRETVRDHITRIARQGDTLTALTQQCGWKAFVTNAVHTRRSLQEAVLGSRHAYRVERLFNRLKSRVHIAPLFVKRNEQIEGLTSLLTLGVRVLTVLEFVLRRSLESEHAKLPGLHPENKQKMADKPTAERILQAFRKMSLTIIKNGAGEEILRRLTPLSGGQEAILQRLGLGTNLYQQLEIQNIEK
jgi:transposase